MTKEEAVSYIENQTWSKTRLGLGRTKELLGKLGNPQDKLKFIHVAGTNGKGSTCAMLESVLRQAGYRTGLYTSPFIEDFNEQLKVCGENIKDEELTELVEQVAPAAEAMEDHPSRFEILTAIGMVYFLKEACDVVILEVGMGGELDSTNVIGPALVSVICNIGLDHTEYLGETISEIAKVKAGIIKKGTICVAYNSGEESISVIENRCNELDVPLVVSDVIDLKTLGSSVDGVEFWDPDFGELIVPLAGEHQKKNAKVVIDVVNCLNTLGFEIDSFAVYAGLSQVKWPARFEVLSHDPLFILDGGHNPQCAAAMAKTVTETLPGEQITLIIGALKDKEIDEMMGSVLPFARRVICLTPNSERAIPAGDLMHKILTYAPDIRVCACEEAEAAINLALEEGGTVLAFGSLYMAGDIRKNFISCKKEQQRRDCFAARKCMTEEERIRADKVICEKLKTNPAVKDAKTIFSYIPYQTEANVSEFNEWAAANRKRVAFPKSRENTGEMEFYVPVDVVVGPYEIGAYGIKEPVAEMSKLCAPSEAEVIILPCVGFDEDGRRLGHGGGFYDRYLERVFKDRGAVQDMGTVLSSGPSIVMVAYELQRLFEVCTDEHDRTADYLVTDGEEA